MKKLITLITLISISIGVLAQGNEKFRLPGPETGYTPSKSNIEARKNFQDMKVGIFIHWGLYSMLGDGEWVMQNKNLNFKEYAHLAWGFYPSKFDANQWVELFKEAGANYMTITTRHHDGFSMFKTNTSNFNIVDGTPFKRDVMKELSQACDKHKLTLNFYYSHLDWYREDYPIGFTGKGTGRDASKADWASYYKFMNTQLTELLTNYGPIGSIWFDGYWDHANVPNFDWQLQTQYELIHTLQPACLIGNNHHRKPYAGEDFQMFERDLPGQNNAGLSANQEVGQLPLETCITLAKGAWGYRITDKFNDITYVIQQLVGAAGRNANLLLNIGPRADGTIPDNAVKVLKEMGEWLKKYGDTIYGTRGGIIPPNSWGVTTQKDNKLFVHILNQEGNELYLATKDAKVKSVTVFEDGSKVKFKKVDGGILVYIPEHEKVTDYILQVNL